MKPKDFIYIAIMTMFVIALPAFMVLTTSMRVQTNGVDCILLSVNDYWGITLSTVIFNLILLLIVGIKETKEAVKEICDTLDCHKELAEHLAKDLNIPVDSAFNRLSNNNWNYDKTIAEFCDKQPAIFPDDLLEVEFEEEADVIVPLKGDYENHPINKPDSESKGYGDY